MVGGLAEGWGCSVEYVVVIARRGKSYPPMRLKKNSANVASDYRVPSKLLGTVQYMFHTHHRLLSIIDPHPEVGTPFTQYSAPLPLNPCHFSKHPK